MYILFYVYYILHSDSEIKISVKFEYNDDFNGRLSRKRL